MNQANLVTCPNCGHGFYSPRHGPRGSGAHYAKRMTRLNRTHELVLDILKSKNAVDYDRGLTLTETWLQAREIRRGTQLPIPTKQGLSGRLSELAGLGMVKTEYNRVELLQPDTMQFRDREKSRWYLVPNAKSEGDGK